MKLRALSFAVLACVWFSPHRPAFAQCQYEATVLPEIDCGFFSGPPEPTAINNLGHVTGYYDCLAGQRAALWTGGERWITLPLPTNFDAARPYGLNDLDEVVGEAVDTVALPGGGTLSTTYACLWRPGRPPQLLGIPAGGNFSIATGINNHSEICGYWGHTVTGPIRAFIWANEVMSTLSVPLVTEAMAEDINDRSQIAGWGFDGLESRCFLWSEGVAHELPMLSRAIGGRVNAIADNGVVVGFSGYQSGVRLATAWSIDTALMLPSMPDFLHCLAWDANSFAIVGECDNYPLPGHGAFLYQDGAVFDLDTLTPGAIVSVAHAINEHGTIVGGGHVKGEQASFLLTPLGSAPADVTRNCVVNIDDLLAVIGQWGPGDSFADIDGDGVVALPDVLLVIEQWSP